MIKDYMRKDLADFKPYHAPVKAYNIKVDANENPYSPSQNMLDNLKVWLEDKDNLTRYPDTDCNIVREKIAEYLKVEKDNVIVTVGSDQLIDIITKTFLEVGDKVLIPNPSFSMYDIYTISNHGQVVKYELDDNFNYSGDDIVKLYNEINPKLIFICSPNNPTGTTISYTEITKVLDHVDCPVILDKAYSEFILDDKSLLFQKYPKLIVVKTFSKAFGLAGLRIGYGLASAEMIEVLNILKPPYNVSSFSQAAATYVLDHADYYLYTIGDLNSDKDKLYSALKSIPIITEIYPSQANFILVKVKDLAVVEYLENHNILVRAYGTEGRLANCIRISVGTTEENDQLVKVLEMYQ